MHPRGSQQNDLRRPSAEDRGRNVSYGRGSGDTAFGLQHRATPANHASKPYTADPPARNNHPASNGFANATNAGPFANSTFAANASLTQPNADTLRRNEQVVSQTMSMSEWDRLPVEEKHRITMARRAEASAAAAGRRKRVEEERAAAEAAEKAAKRAAGQAAHGPMSSMHALRNGVSGGSGGRGSWHQQQRSGQPMPGSCSQPPANIHSNSYTNDNNHPRPAQGVNQASRGAQQAAQPHCHTINSSGNCHQYTTARDSRGCDTRERERESTDQLSGFQFSSADVRCAGPAVREGERARGQGKLPVLRCQQERELGEASVQLRYLIDMTIGR